MKGSGKLIIILTMIITIVFSTVVSVLATDKRVRRNAEREYTIISSGVDEAIRREIAKPIYTGLTMANDVFLMDLLNDEANCSDAEFEKNISRYLQAIKDSTNAQTVFLISEGSKKYYTFEGFNKVVDPVKDDHDVWYSIFVNSRKKYDLDVDIDQVNGDKWTVFINARIEGEDGNLLGVCGLGISMNQLQRLLKEYEDNYAVKTNFVDSDGQLQIDTDTVNIENAVLHDVQYGREMDGYAYENSDGEYIIMKFIDDLNWYLVVHGKPSELGKIDATPIVAGAICIIVINLFAIFIFSGKSQK